MIKILKKLKNKKNISKISNKKINQIYKINIRLIKIKASEVKVSSLVTHQSLYREIKIRIFAVKR